MATPKRSNDYGNVIRAKALKTFGLTLFVTFLAAQPAVGCAHDGDDTERLSLFEHQHLVDANLPSCLVRWRRAHRYGNEREVEIRREWSAYATTLGTSVNLADAIYARDFTALKEEAAAAEGTLQKRLRAVWTYLYFVDTAYPVVVGNDVLWLSGSELEKQKEDALVLLAQARKHLAACKDPFLRDRWAFQVVRLEAMYGSPTGALETFEQYLAKAELSVVRMWAASYCGKAYRDLGKRVEAAATYVSLWGDADWMGGRVLLSLTFLKLETAEWEQLLRQLDDPDAKLFALFVRNLIRERDYSVDTLQQMVALKPGSPTITAVLQQFMHSIEWYEVDYLRARFFHAAGPGDRFSDLADFVKQQADTGKVSDPTYWQLAAAYLFLLDGRHDGFRECMTSARANKQAASRYTAMIQRLTLGARFTAASPQGFDSEARKMLVRRLEHVQKKIDERYDPHTAILRWTLTMLPAYYYLREQDTFRAALAFRLAGYGEFSDELMDSYADEETLEAWKDIATSPPGDAWERRLIETIPRISHFMSYQHVILLLREQRYQEAEAFMVQRSLPPAKTSVEPGYLPWPDVHWGEAAPQVDRRKNLLTLHGDLLTWARMMRELHQKRDAAATQAERDQINLKLGHILFHAVSGQKAYKHLVDPGVFPLSDVWPRGRQGYHRNIWVYKPPYFHETAGKYNMYFRKEDEMRRRRNRFERAAQSYREVLQNTQDPELAAQVCVYLQMSDHHTIYKGMTPDADKHQYYFRLARDYGDTKFYGEFVKTCPLIEMFH